MGPDLVWDERRECWRDINHQGEMMFELIFDMFLNETEKAWLVKYQKQAEWFPKSRCFITNESILIPKWMMMKRPSLRAWMREQMEEKREREAEEARQKPHIYHEWGPDEVILEELSDEDLELLEAIKE